MLVPPFVALEVLVLYLQQPLIGLCLEVAESVLKFSLVGLILRLFFYLFLFCKIHSDMLFTSTCHDSV